MSRLTTFGQSVVTWDPNTPPFEKNRESAVQYLRHIVDADIAAAEGTAQKQEDDAKRSQQAQTKYSQPYPAKGRGKAAVVVKHPALAPRKRRPLGLPTHHTARMDVPRGMTGTGVDAGTGTTPATVGLSIDSHQALFQLSPLTTVESAVLLLSFGPDIANSNHSKAFALMTSPAQAEAVAVRWFRIQARFRISSHAATPISSALLCAA